MTFTYLDEVESRKELSDPVLVGKEDEKEDAGRRRCRVLHATSNCSSARRLQNE
jgi:hypothetical protein